MKVKIIFALALSLCVLGIGKNRESILEPEASVKVESFDALNFLSLPSTTSLPHENSSAPQAIHEKNRPVGVNELIALELKIKHAENVTEFRNLLTQTLPLFPTPQRIREQNEETHEDPVSLVRAGGVLAAIREQIEKNAEFKEVAEDFYLACAEEAHLLRPIRALCLENWIAYNKAQRNKELIAQRYDPDLVRLVDF